MLANSKIWMDAVWLNKTHRYAVKDVSGMVPDVISVMGFIQPPETLQAAPSDLSQPLYRSLAGAAMCTHPLCQQLLCSHSSQGNARIDV